MSTHLDQPRLLLVSRLLNSPPPFSNINDTRNMHGRPVSFWIAHLSIYYIHPSLEASSIVGPSNKEHQATLRETTGYPVFVELHKMR